MRIRVQRVELFATECRTRIPFRFGAFTLEETPYCTARVTVECADGTPSVGHSADLLIPKWFDKNPETTLRADSEALARSAVAAGQAFVACGDSTVFEAWWEAYRSCVQPVGVATRLVAGFGVSLIERAVIDATCRAAGLSFFDAVKSDLLGFRPEEVLSDVSRESVINSLPEQPSGSVHVRHTVGLLDFLRVSDIPDDRRVADGLPQALEEDIDRYGLTIFKVKIGGGQEVDVPRLIELAKFFESKAPDYSVTLDGNEQYQHLDELADVLDAVKADSAGARLLERLRYIEQPLHRSATFDANRHSSLARVNAHAPLIIDEADHGVDAFPDAFELGYRGVSVKNCKGVFRALINRGYCVTQQSAFQSAEDLTNLPVLALQQDLATIQLLGLPHAERNGHHYFRGLAHLPAAEMESALTHHSDLYHRTGEQAQLRIDHGALNLASIHAPGYGYSSSIDTDSRPTLDDWLERS